jgi:hypothetical protein
MEEYVATLDAALSELNDARNTLDLVRDQLVEARAEARIAGRGDIPTKSA